MKLIKKSSLNKEKFHKKQRVSRQKSFDLLPSKAFIQILYVYIVRNIKHTIYCFIVDFFLLFVCNNSNKLWY